MATSSCVVVQDTLSGVVIGNAVNHSFNPVSDVVLSRNRTSDWSVMGGVIFTAYTGTTVTIHCASFTRNWINRLFIWACTDYIFRQLDVKQVIAPIASDNTRSLRVAAHLGFRLVSVIPDYYAVGVAQHILRLRREDCDLMVAPPTRMAVYRDRECQVLVANDG